MRHWTAVTSTALSTVADRPALWLPGSLAWVATIGWIPFAVAVARPPTVAELTFLGPRFYTSGLWPINLGLVGLGAVALVVLLLLAAAAGNALLVAAAQRRPPSSADVPGLLLPSLIGAAPVAFGMLLVAVALIAVGPAEFNRPQLEPGPVVRTALRLAPLLVFTAVVAIVAATLAGLAGRAAIAARSITAGIRAVPGQVRRAGRPGLVHLVVAVLIGAGYFLLATLLLRVLWAPIGVGLETGTSIDLAAAPLLVGFVAIWLCLVLGGGAIHAWSSMTTTLLLSGATAGVVPDRPQETLIDR